jgi:hypothetical protein
MSAAVITGCRDLTSERLLTQLGGDDYDLTGFDVCTGADGELCQG